MTVRNYLRTIDLVEVATLLIDVRNTKNLT